MEPVHVFHINVLFGKISKVNSCGLAGRMGHVITAPSPALCNIFWKVFFISPIMTFL